MSLSHSSNPGLLDRIMTFDPATQRGLIAFTREWFAQEDDVLAHVRHRTRELGMPEIQIRPEEGQILYFLARMIGARHILEVGTLAGYSTIWLARAVPEDGSVVTLEVEPSHARVAREHFALAGLNGRVEIVEGSAHETLPILARREPFDLMFIDADKAGYPAYLAWALENLPNGALIVAHNAFREGKLISDTPDDAALATRELLHAMARDERLLSTIIPVGDGFAVGMIQRGVGTP